MFIITNCTPEGNYTPTVVKTKIEAINWMTSCTKNNIIASSDKFNEPVSINEVFEWAKNNMDFKISDEESKLYYSDGSYNIMQIFEFPSIDI